jgi:energy-coupling factor transport system ATP-binding protein
MKKNDFPIIEVKSLSHTYLPGTPLAVDSLSDVSLSVFQNETIGIIGPTGSGKSTLLHHLNGLLLPKKGDVLINGTSVSKYLDNIREIRQVIGLVFQNPENQLFERYAGDDVAFGPRNLDLSREEVRKRVMGALEDVGLPFTDKDRLTSELSPGEKRRLALAGVLAMEPDVLVLDEPTASLDPQGRQELIGVLSRWKEQRGKAVVIATHNMEDIAQLADRIYMLFNGKILLQGSTREVFSRYDVIIQHGLNVPVATEIMYKLSLRGFSISRDVLNIEEAAEVIRGFFHV